jgi:UDP-3-O-[3-hydroxymyristoyl] glucosamine N-acyltransferase
LKTCPALVVLAARNLASRPDDLALANGDARTVILVDDPIAAFVQVLRLLHGEAERPPHGIDPKASVHHSVQTGPGVSIFPFAVVSEGVVLGAGCTIHSGAVIGRNCRLGDGVILYANVVLYEGTIVGDRAIVHANAVLGADGFGYRLTEGKHAKVPQLGNVEIGDDVEIGACTTIDRGTFQPTRVGNGTKIDNQVMIGHNCQIGRHNLLISQVGIAGSSSTGDYVVLAGQVGVADHVHVGDRAVIGAKSGLMRDVAPGERMLGAPARPEREAKRILLCLDQLPDLCKEARKRKQQLDSEKDSAGVTDAPSDAA